MTTLPSTLTLFQTISSLLIDGDPTQPRQAFDPIELNDLAASMRAQGIVTPLRVVAKPGGRFQLLYGERRLRAAQLAELETVPCLVDQDTPSWTAALDIQLTENLHRADLRPLEVAQTLWRRILGANIEALEAEQGDDGSATAQVLGTGLTPASQITALEARLCALAGVPTVATYFGSGRVRAPRKLVLGRYGMADWSESRLKKLFGTLDVAPLVQEMLAGVDVSARALRDLKGFDPETQAALVEEARTAESGDVGAALRGAIDKRDGKKNGKGQPVAESTDDVQERASSELLPIAEGNGKEFVPDPQLAFLTGSSGSAARLVTDQAAPQRGSVPASGKVGEWHDDSVLLLESALEAARNIVADVQVLRLNQRQLGRLAPLWSQLVEALQRTGLEA